jgi:Xaa-Pro aminopeptidase
VPFLPGMILSNEPGFYREGAFGIRIENLIVCEEAPTLPRQTVPQMLRFETLTLVPIDLRLVEPELLTKDERLWLNGYHQRVFDTIAPDLVDVPPLEGSDIDAGVWLQNACRGI